MVERLKAFRRGEESSTDVEYSGIYLVEDKLNDLVGEGGEAINLERRVSGESDRDSNRSSPCYHSIPL